MIVQNTSIGGATDISFTVPKADLAASERVTGALVAEIGASGVTHDENIGRVSLVGAGMKTNPASRRRCSRPWPNNGVNIEMISTSSIRISCVVAAHDVERSVQALHDAFALSA